LRKNEVTKNNIIFKWRIVLKIVEFGNTKEKLSEMCLGTMMFGDRCSEAEADRITATAIDAGVNFIDTAAMYCEGLTEEILGRIFKKMRGRDKLFIATKVHKGVDRESILKSIDESLARLKMDYVDLYMIHWPKKGMNPVEIMEALAKIVETNKTRFVGCCNYPAWLLAHHNAIARCNDWLAFVCNQIPYNLIERGPEVEVLPQAVAENIAITCYRVFLLGLLTGKYRPGAPIPGNSRGESDERIGTWLNQHADGITKFLTFAQELNVTPSELAISWIRYSPAVTNPIIGVSSENQLRSSLNAFEFDLTEEQYAKITNFFDTEVKEESGGAYKALRRELKLLETPNVDD
jgi:aryl-alcohol dehydrogenase-like predicted oxidoreductase